MLLTSNDSNVFLNFENIEVQLLLCNNMAMVAQLPLTNSSQRTAVIVYIYIYNNKSSDTATAIDHDEKKLLTE